MVTLKIDNQTVTVPEGTTILEAAKSVHINIPTLCYLKDINEIAACRLCVVEIEGHVRLVPSCDNVVSEGMVVYTNSPRVREARRVNLRLLLSQHDTQCTKCTRSGNCKLQQLTTDYNLLGEHYVKDLKKTPDDYSNPIVRVTNRCVRCMRCVQICDKVQSMNIWDLIGTGSRTDVGVRNFRTLAESDCTFCGQCVTHCPVGALQERDDTGRVWDALADPKKVTIVQVAPAVRAAWAEHYHLDPKFATAKRMVSCLKEMGFNYVFDPNFAADLTIMEEGSEFIERFTHRDQYRWPMFTSCCPGWVSFIKSQFPEYVKNLSTAKSPQQMFGAVAKSYFAEKMGIDPKKMFVVSIMPCSAKKAEKDLPGMNSACGDPDVDVVLVAVPHYFHVDIAIEAMRNNKHVLVEKPIAVHKAEAERLLAEAVKYPHLVKALMFNQRTLPAHKKSKQLIDSGELGKINRINWVITDWFRSQAYYDSGAWRATWAGEGGGVLLNQCPHQLDLWQWICGMPVKVHAHMKYGSISSNLKVGDIVKQGEQIGQIGSTGCSTGNHLHYEVILNGERVDPTDYMDLTNASGTCKR